MLKKFVCIAILLYHPFATLFGQTADWLLSEQKHDDYEQLISIRKTPLFNKDEIRQRGIQSCTIFYHVTKSKYNTKERTDSFAVFWFDAAGNTSLGLMKNSRRPVTSDWDTVIGKSNKYVDDEKKDSVIRFEKGRKIVTSYYFMAYKPGSISADSTKIRKEVYDKKNRLLEIKDKLIKSYYNYLCLNFCCDQPQIHAIIRYDKYNNITLYREPGSYNYSKFRHKPTKRIVYTYHTSAKKKREKQIIPVIINADSMTEKRKEILTLYRLEKNSRLLRLMKHDFNHINFGVREYIFRYNYREEKAPLKN